MKRMRGFIEDYSFEEYYVQGKNNKKGVQPVQNS
jgi:hypothetical protein